MWGVCENSSVYIPYTRVGGTCVPYDHLRIWWVPWLGSLPSSAYVCECVLSWVGLWFGMECPCGCQVAVEVGHVQCGEVKVWCVSGIYRVRDVYVHVYVLWWWW